MSRGLARRPFLVAVCVLCLTALACGASDDDRPSDETIATTSSADSSNNDEESGATTSTTPTADTTTTASTATTTTTATGTDSADTSTATSTAPTADDTVTTTTVAGGTTITPDTTTKTSTATPETATTTSTTTGTAPVDVAVSPWPIDPRVADDREWGVRIETSWRHDTDAFTQGLETNGNIIYESTGLYGESRLRALDGANELRSVAIDADLFGEGLTLVGDEIIQLSWREGRALRWDRETFEPRGEFRYAGEGWGICWDQVRSRLLMSDGTSTLTHRDRDDFTVVATTTILRNNEPVRSINELECVDGLVVANVWMTNEIIVFDPDSGAVLVSIDAASLATEAGISVDETHAVLNGVAYRGDGKWILGGKNWPLQFLVTLTVD